MPEKSDKWALLIGVDQYHESLGSLKYAGADCRALRDVLVSPAIGFPADQILLLDDLSDSEHRPTFAKIQSHLASWLSAPKEDDLILVYFSGHGRYLDGKSYLVPGDATLPTVHTLGIPLSHVQDVIGRCKAKRKLFIVDACHSGSGRDISAMNPAMHQTLAAANGMYTITSCGAEELSHEWEEKRQGVFSYFLCEALRGRCVPAADGRLTMDRVYDWVHERVVKWAAKQSCVQHPERFARGAGTLVLAQSDPDPMALAEEYRRELERTKARLAELELAQKHTETKQRKGLQTKPSEVRQEVSSLAQKFTCPVCSELADASDGDFCEKCGRFVHTKCQKSVRVVKTVNWGRTVSDLFMSGICHKYVYSFACPVCCTVVRRS